LDKAIDKILKEFIDKSKDVITSDEIYLYGSYAKGTERPDSDIDVAVILNDFTGDYLEKSAQLYSIVSKIDYRIEPLLLIKTYDKPGFIDHIKSYGIRLY
jgi:predicted nucleotidyltransferase